MRSNGISVRLRDFNDDIIQEYQPPTYSRRCLISAPALSRFKVCLIIHDDFDWKDSDHVIIIVQPGTLVEKSMIALSRDAVTIGVENRFGIYELTTARGQQTPNAFVMPQPCLLDLTANSKLKEHRGQQVDGHSSTVNITQSRRGADSMVFMMINKDRAHIPSSMVRKGSSETWRLPSMAGLLSNDDTDQAMTSVSRTTQPVSYAVNQQTHQEYEQSPARSPPIEYQPARDLKIATTPNKRRRPTDTIDVTGGEDQDEGMSLPVTSKTIISTAKHDSEPFAASQTQRPILVVFSTSSSLPASADEKEKKRARLMLELEKLELRKKELAIKEQLLALDG